MKNLENHIGKILITLICSFIIGTVAMIYNNDKVAALLAKEISHVATNFKEFKDDYKKTSHTFWKRQDHDSYASFTKEKIQNLEKRIERVERSKKL